MAPTDALRAVTGIGLAIASAVVAASGPEISDDELSRTERVPYHRQIPLPELMSQDPLLGYALQAVASRAADVPPGFTDRRLDEIAAINLLLSKATIGRLGGSLLASVQLADALFGPSEKEQARRRISRANFGYYRVRGVPPSDQGAVDTLLLAGFQAGADFVRSLELDCGPSAGRVRQGRDGIQAAGVLRMRYYYCALPTLDLKAEAVDIPFIVRSQLVTVPPGESQPSITFVLDRITVGRSHFEVPLLDNKLENLRNRLAISDPFIGNLPARIVDALPAPPSGFFPVHSQWLPDEKRWEIVVDPKGMNVRVKP